MSWGKWSVESVLSRVVVTAIACLTGLDRSDRPGFLDPPHLPEHPLVPARHAEVTAYSGALIIGKALGNPVYLGENISDDAGVLVAPVGRNPALVTGIRRAAAEEFLADGGVNPVTRQDRAEGFRIAAAPHCR